MNLTEHKIEGMIVKSKGVSKRAYCFTNDLNFALFSVSSCVQVKQGVITMILNCSVPISIRELKSFHGVCVLSIVSLYYQQMLNSSPRADCVPRDYLWSEFFYGPYNDYTYLLLYPSDAPTLPNQFLTFGFMKYASHRFNDPYLIDTSFSVF